MDHDQVGLHWTCEHAILSSGGLFNALPLSILSEYHRFIVSHIYCRKLDSLCYIIVLAENVHGLQTRPTEFRKITQNNSLLHRSRSFKVTIFCTNLKPVCNTLPMCE